MLLVPMFDQQCLRTLLTLHEPWSIPDAARAWTIDFGETREIMARYLQTGWLLMTHPGHYRFTRIGRMTAQGPPMGSDTPLSRRQPAHIERRNTLNALTFISATGLVTVRSLAFGTGKTEEASRKELARFAERGWARVMSMNKRFQEWGLTEDGIKAMQNIATELRSC